MICLSPDFYEKGSRMGTCRDFNRSFSRADSETILTFISPFGVRAREGASGSPAGLRDFESKEAA